MQNGLLLCLFLLLISCNRSQIFGDIEPNTNRVVAEFTDARTGTTVSHDFSTIPIEVELAELRLDPRALIDHDTKVKVIVNPSVVTAYNATNGTNFKSVPAANFSLSKSSYQLSPSTRNVPVMGVLQPSTLLDASYAIGLSIAEMSDGDISPVGKNVIVFITIKNEFDGIYRARGFSQIPGTPYTGQFSVACADRLEVATSGANSVSLSPSQPVANGSSFTYISNLLPDLQIDKTTNKVTAVNSKAGGIDLLFPFDAAYNSRYDAATKTIYVKYGVAPAGSGRFVIDTLIYCGPR